jgi:hypothetical protein
MHVNILLAVSSSLRDLILVMKLAFSFLSSIAIFHTYFNLHRVSLLVIFMEDLAIMILFPVLILLWSTSSVSVLGLNVQLIF